MTEENKFPVGQRMNAEAEKDKSLKQMCCAAYPILFLAVLLICLPQGILGQTLQEQDGLCNAERCYSVHFQRKTFRESWKSCKDKGGSLATVKRPEEAALIQDLLNAADRHGPRPRLRLWIGLQRQPRQCSATRPLRGFTWITGDQEMEYTNWQREELPGACAAPRCVVITYNTTDKSNSDQNNFKWLDGSCLLAVDGFLCHYTYKGMCPALQSEGKGPALYTTPFDLHSTLLSHVPFGSVATLPCPDITKGDQSVLCMLHENGSVGWSKDAPLCSDTSKDWCEQDNGGCEHFCVNAGFHYYCECSEDFKIGEDGQSCQPLDPCHSSDCEFDCEPSPGGYRCKCPEGYFLSKDGLNCIDIDECSQNPCPQVCVNAPGTFECRCNEGYQLSKFGECLDVDECKEGKCEHFCENSLGSYTCLCHEGFAPIPDDLEHCEDINECQHTGICEQICDNYEGGFQCSCEAGYELQQDEYSCLPVSDMAEQYTTAEPAHMTTPVSDEPATTPDTVTDEITLKWHTEPPRTEWITTGLDWFTDTAQEEYIASPGWTEQTTNSPASDWLEDFPTTNIPADSNAKNEINPWFDESRIESQGEAHLPSTLSPNGNGDADRITPLTHQIHMSTLPSTSSQEKNLDGKKKHDRSWLLVALLVPLCVFIVVMLALGIVYCTSCAVEPRDKTVTDCYSWTTNSKPAETKPAKSKD
ncbi:endosialin [Tachysurus fulvidraco]|uniref:endosialin n=1 Tax=Tachysurus fulvidraco TaxID=1234273 RepID=UPI001FEDB6C6|nr:endosialin [Tachysurus fulvidraco]